MRTRVAMGLFFLFFSSSPFSSGPLHFQPKDGWLVADRGCIGGLNLEDGFACQWV